MLHESSRAVITTGCAVGVVAGVLSAIGSVAAIESTDIGYLDPMTENAFSIAVLLIAGIAFGAVCGFAIGGVESAASFAIAMMAAKRTMSCRTTFVVLAFVFTAINVSAVSIADVVLLGTDGEEGIDYFASAVVAIATIATTAVFGWAHSLDWPQRIDIRTEYVPRNESSSQTERNEGLIDALQTRLHD